MAQSKAVRDRKNRQENTVRGQEVVGGVQIRATEYTTGRVEVQCKTVPVMNSQQAAYAFVQE